MATLQSADVNSFAANLAAKIQELHLIDPESVNGYSNHVFYNYLDALDPLHRTLLKADVDDFKRYENVAWPALKEGNIELGVCIYSRFRQRSDQARAFALHYLEHELTPQKLEEEDQFPIRSIASEWFGSESEQIQYWHQNVKLKVLSKLQSGETFEAAKMHLINRFKGDVRRNAQADANMVFSTYANAFLDVLDTNSEYYAPISNSKYDLAASFKLVGIGLVLESSDEGASVVSVVPGGPSDGKLFPGDIIVGLANDGLQFEPVGGWSLDEIIERLRGEKETYVGLEVKSKRSSAGMARMSIMRNAVKLKDRAVDSKIVHAASPSGVYKIGILSVPVFYADFRAMESGDPNARTVSRDLKIHMQQLKQQGVSAWVLDMRQNGGGSLQEANNVAALFVSQGKTFSITARNSTETMAGSGEGPRLDGPLVVLVDNRSSGATEIVAGAIQDYGAGVVVGAKTFGMGSVGVLRELSQDDSPSVKITVAQYYRVTGEGFAGKGVVPDVSLPGWSSSDLHVHKAFDGYFPVSISSPLKFTKQADLSGVRRELLLKSEYRQVKHPVFQLISSENKGWATVAERKSVPLKRPTYEAQAKHSKQEALSRLNNYRRAKGLPAATEVTSADTDKIMEDAWLDEAVQIAADWIDLKK